MTEERWRGRGRKAGEEGGMTEQRWRGRGEKGRGGGRDD